jgi:hypothetical protein
MARRKRTQKELQAVAVRLRDEVRHLTVLVNAIVAPRPEWPPVVVQALTEAFLAHARALARFLHPARAGTGEAVAADFFRSPKAWERLRLAPSPKLAALRSGPGGPRIAFGADGGAELPDAGRVLEIAGELSAGVSIFLAHAPRTALGPAWDHVRND